MNRYEKAKQYFQNVLSSAAKSGNSYELNQVGYSEISIAIEALDKQIEIEKAQFTHICKSNNDLYPTTFSIYARIAEDYGQSITIERFQKFGALPLGNITISKDDFNRYYKPIKQSDKLGVIRNES